jgi:2-dehydropantoate 2-reductase
VTRFTVLGAGAIGGLVAARLALAGEAVSVIARGESLRAIGRDGLRLIEPDGSERQARIEASVIDEAPACDVLFLAVKSWQVAQVAADAARLIGETGFLVPMQNGVPWWFLEGREGPFGGRPIEAVDPGGAVARALPVGKVVGAVVYPAAELTAPGVIRVIEGDRLGLGEPSGEKSERVAELSAALARAGFKAAVTSDIRAEIWLKLLGNMAFNPISALTHATLAEIAGFAPTRALVAGMMAEAKQVGEKLGVRVRIPIERRIAGAEAVGAHKTSMLQDVEAGRRLELEALLGAVAELGRMTETATPLLDAVLALARLLARRLAETGARLALEGRA